MTIKRIVLVIPIFTVIAFVPVLPLVYLSDTSWVPVWWVYPSICNLFSGGYHLNYYRELLFCLLVVGLHFGLSFGAGIAADKILFRPKK